MSNLSVFTGAKVQKIGLAEGEGERIANTVHFHREGKSYNVKVRKEVIIAAGTFQSPKILELSGGFFDASRARSYSGGTKLYLNYKAGPMTVGGIASYAFMPMTSSKPTSDKISELRELLKQYPADPGNQLQYGWICRILQKEDEDAVVLFMFLAQTNLHNDDSAKDYLQNLQPGSFISLGACQSYVFSRGASHIVSKHCSEPTKINPQYLSHPLDLELLARHVQFIEQLARSPPLSKHIKLNGKRNHPTADVEDIIAAKDSVRRTAFSSYHPAGTCAMLL
ncbi:MAG: hypothetical protein Q9209_004284 [Squamulea sp. 1 TL-2023]